MVKNNSRKEILVFAHWSEMTEPHLMGALYSEIIRGNEIFSFEYFPEWLKSKYAQVIDPNLQLYSGIQYASKNNFGLFLDSSPDCWGRILMKRREAVSAKMEKRAERILSESDFLLGVYDEHRMGGLRFKEDIEGPFLNHDKKFSAPPWTSLSELEQISLKIENDDISNDPEYLTLLSMLLAPGSSLGGARPKASVIDSAGNLWIAKFPSINDEKNIGAWEMVAHDLAAECRINIGETMIKKFSHKYHTFLSKRFDRNKKNRLHFASAMTMLGYSDGTDYHAGASYIELAEFLIINGANVNNDLEELWKRIVFSICITNTDDHLRNHGFILSERGWLLSPAFDINPVETGTGLKLNITETDNSLNIDLALEVIEIFRLNRKKAESIISNVINAVKNWRNIASKYNISKPEQDRMARAFRTSS